MKIVIVIEGGFIQDIFTDSKDVEILLCDYDTEGAEPDSLMEAPCGDMGIHHRIDPSVEPGLVEAWFSRWGKKEVSEE